MKIQNIRELLDVSSAVRLIQQQPRFAVAIGTVCILGGATYALSQRKPRRKRRVSGARDSLFINAESEHTARALITEAETHLPFAVRIEHVETRFGRTNIMVVGPERAPPLILWHGLDTPAAFDVHLWNEWSQSFRIYSPAIPGQPGGCYMSPQLADAEEELGKWALEVMVGLGIDRCPMVGVSSGCSILFIIARTTPKRIKQAVFINPPSIGQDTWTHRLK